MRPDHKPTPGAEFNPYAPPTAPIGPPAGAETTPSNVYRDGSLLVLRQGAELPDRCVRCNAPAGPGRIVQGFRHFHLWWPCTQAARVAVPLCPRHQARRHRAITLGGLGILLTFGLFLGSIPLRLASPFGLIPLVAFLLFLACIGVVDDGLQVVGAHRITARFVWLRKASPAFLAELPAWPSRRGRSA